MTINDDGFQHAAITIQVIHNHAFLRLVAAPIEISILAVIIRYWIYTKPTKYLYGFYNFSISLFSPVITRFFDCGGLQVVPSAPTL
jgi:hypothetical protein